MMIEQHITIQEKLQWLKDNNGNPLAEKCKDQLKLREYLKSVLGKDFCMPALKIYKSSVYIEWDKLPKSFVIKCNLNNKSIFVKDKDLIDREDINQEVDSWIIDEQHKIVVEKYLVDKKDIQKYGLWYFNGELKIYTISGYEYGKEYCNFYDENDKILGNFSLKEIPIDESVAYKQSTINLMKRYGDIISKPFRFNIVDCYYINGELFIDEIDFERYLDNLEFSEEIVNYILGNFLKTEFDEFAKYMIRPYTINRKEAKVMPKINQKCCVVIPVYKEKLEGYEKASLIQCYNVLGKSYDICLVMPDNLKDDFYDWIIPGYTFSKIKLNPLFFESRESYSVLCENIEFYKSFKEYEYILIYQTDAWVFSDRLNEFCKMGYDYIGAAHVTSTKRKVHVGNGGFSLRKVEKFLEVIPQLNFYKYYQTYNRIISEDCAIISSNQDLFNLPDKKIADDFSVQGVPKSKNLPFGCHAFQKLGWEEWKNYINENVQVNQNFNTISKICYTVITGGYDKIRTPEIVTNGWRYICFSDVQIEDPVWEFKPIPKDVEECGLSNLKINRKLKILGHRYLPNHELNMYVDGNILIKTNLDDFIYLNCRDNDLSIPKHFERDCIYEEAAVVVAKGKEEESIANEVIRRYEEEGFPHHYGLSENNVIIRKNTDEVRDIMEKWYEEYIKGSRRDQLSLMYVLWKNNFSINFLDSKTTRSKDSPLKHDGGKHNA